LFSYAIVQYSLMQTHLPLLQSHSTDTTAILAPLKLFLQALTAVEDRMFLGR